MNKGDECWVLWPVTDICRGRYVRETEMFVYVKLNGQIRPMLFFKDEVFPTREALEEHYKSQFDI